MHQEICVHRLLRKDESIHDNVQYIFRDGKKIYLHFRAAIVPLINFRTVNVLFDEFSRDQFRTTYFRGDQFSLQSIFPRSISRGQFRAVNFARSIFLLPRDNAMPDVLGHKYTIIEHVSRASAASCILR